MNQKLIFVVDDNVMFADMLSDHLSRNPAYKVMTFDTGEACLKNLFHDPDLIILDYYLNDVYKDAANGLEILQAMKNQKYDPKVIMLSSQERYAVAAQTISKGARHYVIKDDDAFKNIDKILRDIF
ncbi:MAG: response regulator [Bacteroidetes bacterium]|jgi:DNA-binding NarL/FixJ family response regulator|nr:response regulator [Bacteroidota bacterium]